MTMLDQPQQQHVEYGLTTQLFVTKMQGKDTVVLGGQGEVDKWTRVLTGKSAHTLWLNLTEFCFPERAREVVSIVATAPLRGTDQPTITTNIQFDVTDDGMVKLTGHTAKQTWAALLTVSEAHHLWQALDKALYPLGWQGPTVTSGGPMLQ
jgi:hypothetical protein